MDNNLNNNTTIDFPKSIEAEKSILGAILISAETVLPKVLGVISSKHFYDDTTSKIFDIIYLDYLSRRSVDPVEISTECINNGIFKSEIDSKNYLGDLMKKVPSVANVMSYCNIVLEKYNLREILKLSQSIKDDVNSGNITSENILEKTSQIIFNMRQNDTNRGLVSIDKILTSAYNSLDDVSGPHKNQYKALPTGFNNLDNIISGLNKSDLLIVAARPGMGKTSFAMNIATHVATHTDKEVAVFSLEMSSEQLALRILSSEALIDSHTLRTGNISAEDWIKLGYSAEKLRHAHMKIDDTAGITVQTMKSRLQNVENLGLVVIDYLQLMSSNLRSDNRVTIVSEITRNVKIMAKDLNVPIILLSQLSRGPESRTDKRPMLSDLRESGSIEQDADIVLFLYRDSYYNPASEQKFVSECIIAKNRHGETGKVELGWNGAYTKFTNLETKNIQPT